MDGQAKFYFERGQAPLPDLFYLTILYSVISLETSRTEERTSQEEGIAPAD
jgi:hypothetical protein